MLYKVGDKVRIKLKEVLKRNTGTVGDMLSYSNKEATILSVLKDGKSEEFGYRIDVDNGFWAWRDADFEGLVSEEKPLISTDLIKDIAEVIKTHNLGVSISENEGRLIIEPLKVEEEDDLERGTYIMCTNDVNNEPWVLRQYLSNGICDSYKTGTFTLPPIPFKYIIPFDKFNPLDIKQSLQYNIVKNNQ